MSWSIDRWQSQSQSYDCAKPLLQHWLFTNRCTPPLLSTYRTRTCLRRSPWGFSQLMPVSVLLAALNSRGGRGDLSTLERICADGLLASFRSRIHARWAAGRPQYSLDWTIHKYTRFARVVSNRAIRLPIPDSGLRQAIVRISSSQSLAKYDFHGILIPGTGEPKDVTEYFVIQKRLINGQETYWEVWGTVEETTVEKLEEEDRIRRGE